MPDNMLDEATQDQPKKVTGFRARYRAGVKIAREDDAKSSGAIAMAQQDAKETLVAYAKSIMHGFRTAKSAYNDKEFFYKEWYFDSTKNRDSDYLEAMNKITEQSNREQESVDNPSEKKRLNDVLLQKIAQQRVKYEAEVAKDSKSYKEDKKKNRVELRKKGRGVFLRAIKEVTSLIKPLVVLCGSYPVMKVGELGGAVMIVGAGVKHALRAPKEEPAQDDVPVEDGGVFPYGAHPFAAVEIASDDDQPPPLPNSGLGGQRIAAANTDFSVEEGEGLSAHSPFASARIDGDVLEQGKRDPAAHFPLNVKTSEADNQGDQKQVKPPLTTRIRQLFITLPEDEVPFSKTNHISTGEDQNTVQPDEAIDVPPEPVDEDQGTAEEPAQDVPTPPEVAVPPLPVSEVQPPSVPEPPKEEMPVQPEVTAHKPETQETDEASYALKGMNNPERTDKLIRLGLLPRNENN